MTQKQIRELLLRIPDSTELKKLAKKLLEEHLKQKEK